MLWLYFLFSVYKNMVCSIKQVQTLMVFYLFDSKGKKNLNFKQRAEWLVHFRAVICLQCRSLERRRRKLFGSQPFCHSAQLSCLWPVFPSEAAGSNPEAALSCREEGRREIWETLRSQCSSLHLQLRGSRRGRAAGGGNEGILTGVFAEMLLSDWLPETHLDVLVV